MKLKGWRWNQIVAAILSQSHHRVPGSLQGDRLGLERQIKFTDADFSWRFFCEKRICAVKEMSATDKATKTPVHMWTEGIRAGGGNI